MDLVLDINKLEIDTDFKTFETALNSRLNELSHGSISVNELEALDLYNQAVSVDRAALMVINRIA